MTLFKAIKKLKTRKKRKGYYEASDILTFKEKQSIIVASLSLLIPVLTTSIMLLLN